MTGVPTIYVDFNRRDPRNPNIFYANLSRIPAPDLGMRIRITDHDEFEFDARLVGMDHVNGTALVEIDRNEPSWTGRAPSIEVFSEGESDSSGAATIRSLELKGVDA